MFPLQAAACVLLACVSKVHLQGTGSMEPFGLLPGSDYEFVPSLGYYKFHDYAASWCMASQICMEEGAHLLIINSEREAELVNTLFERYPVIRGEAASNEWAWIGLHEKGVNGNFFTVLGERLENAGFQRWAEGFPARPGPNECALVSRATAALSDDPCSFRYAFVCEHFLNSAADSNVNIDIRIKKE